jgi:hypothetical protein
VARTGLLEQNPRIESCWSPANDGEFHMRKLSTSRTGCPH